MPVGLYRRRRHTNTMDASVQGVIAKARSMRLFGVITVARLVCLVGIVAEARLTHFARNNHRNMPVGLFMEVTLARLMRLSVVITGA